MAISYTYQLVEAKVKKSYFVNIISISIVFISLYLSNGQVCVL